MPIVIIGTLFSTPAFVNQIDFNPNQKIFSTIIQNSPEKNLNIKDTIDLNIYQTRILELIKLKPNLNLQEKLIKEYLKIEFTRFPINKGESTEFNINENGIIITGVANLNQNSNVILNNIQIALN